LQPIEQRGLFKPIKTAERRRNEIAFLEHFPRNLRITRFVGSEKRNRKPEKIDENYDERE
jgi:hypothetical protein